MIMKKKAILNTKEIQYNIGMKQFKCTYIEWDTEDGAEQVDLPTSTTIEAENEEDIADALSDKYGWCVKYLNIARE